jgi:hypothetical protein
MAKAVTVQYDDEGNPTVSMTELPPAPPASPKKRIPSSPHKPFISTNFYDLTKATPDGMKKPAAEIVDLTNSNTSSPEMVVRSTTNQRPHTSGANHMERPGFTRPQTSQGQQTTNSLDHDDRRQTTGSPFKTQERHADSGFRALQQMDRHNNTRTVPTIPGPYRSNPENQKSTSQSTASQAPGFKARKRIY